MTHSSESSGVKRLSAVIFDFDGIARETERPWRDEIQREYRAHGNRLSDIEWAEMMHLDECREPFRLLHQRTGKFVDTERRQQLDARAMESIRRQPLRTGYEVLLANLGVAGIPTATATNASRQWINWFMPVHVEGSFGAVVTRDDVARGKPYPDVYLRACEALGVAPADAVAIEDCQRGAEAALAAGLTCVYVPTDTTAHITPTGVTRFESLDDVTVEALQEVLRAARQLSPVRSQHLEFAP